MDELDLLQLVSNFPKTPHNLSSTGKTSRYDQKVHRSVSLLRLSGPDIRNHFTSLGPEWTVSFTTLSLELGEAAAKSQCGNVRMSSWTFFS